MRVSCAGFKETPVEAPLFGIGGSIYIYKAGGSPSTALPCFSSRFSLSFLFSFFVHMISKEDDALFIPRLQLLKILFFFFSTQTQVLRTRNTRFRIDQVSVGPWSLFLGAARTSSQQRAVNHKAIHDVSSLARPRQPSNPRRHTVRGLCSHT